MAGEPDNLVLMLLREIRATVERVQAAQDQHTERFTRIDQRLDEMHESMITALGLAGHANLRHDQAILRHESVERRLDDITKRLERLEARS